MLPKKHPGERIDGELASHSQQVVGFVRGHDKPRLMGVAIAIDPFQVVYMLKIQGSFSSQNCVGREEMI